MGLFHAGVQIVRTTIRNELRLKPIARKAAREVTEFLKAKAVSYRAVEVWLGLAGPERLRCVVFVPNDETKARCESDGYVPALSGLFRNALVQHGYPAAAVPSVGLTVHSDQAIRRAGGHHLYFN